MYTGMHICHSNNSDRSAWGRGFIITLKYFPIVQTLGMLINNTCYVFNVYPELCFILDFLIGNSLITTILIFIASYIFKFCKWHRAMIICNFVNVVVAYMNYMFIKDAEGIIIPVITYVIISITILVSLFYKFVIKQ